MEHASLEASVSAVLLQHDVEFDDPEFGSFDETGFLLSAYLKIGSLVHLVKQKQSWPLDITGWTSCSTRAGLELRPHCASNPAGAFLKQVAPGAAPLCTLRT